MTPKPSEVVQAARNTSAADFRETHPFTQEVEDALLEHKSRLMSEQTRVAQQARDIKLALETIDRTIENIRGAKV